MAAYNRLLIPGFFSLNCRGDTEFADLRRGPGGGLSLRRGFSQWSIQTWRKPWPNSRVACLLHFALL